MKTYLEIRVPMSYDAQWFEELRQKMSDANVNWQQGYYHITMAFCDETPDVDLRPILEKHLSNAEAPELCFDKLDAFDTPSGMIIIHLGVSNIPNEFSSLIRNIRKDLKEKGCVMLSDFKLHVTLGRLKDSNVGVSEIKETLKAFSLPPFRLQPTDVRHLVLGTREVIYETKLH